MPLADDRIQVSPPSTPHPRPIAKPQEALYTKTGGNRSIRSEPEVVHFPGYRINERNAKSFRIQNVSGDRQRVHVLIPDTIEFDIVVDNKGWMAPGLSIRVEVVFRPTSWRYHSDHIRIHHGHGDLIVPIHAYPVVDDISFPRQIDMGICPLGSIVYRSITLSSSIPISFQYQLKPIRTSSEFRIHPLQGEIPANGSTEVVIRYEPNRQHTDETSFQVSISQLFFQPFVCSVIGSSSIPPPSSCRNPSSSPHHSPLPQSVKDHPRAPYHPSSPHPERSPGKLTTTPTDEGAVPDNLSRAAAVRYILSQSRIHDMVKLNQTGHDDDGHNEMITEDDGRSGMLEDNTEFPGHDDSVRWALFNQNYRKARLFSTKFKLKPSWNRIGQKLLSTEQIKAMKEQTMDDRERLNIPTDVVDDTVLVSGLDNMNLVPPTWTQHHYPDWSQSHRALKRLVGLFTKVIINTRVLDRIEKIRSYSPESTSVVEPGYSDAIWVQESMISDEKPQEQDEDDDEPVYDPALFCVEPIDNRPEIELFDITEAEHSTLMGYHEYNLGQLPDCIPRLDPRMRMRSGSQREDYIDGWRLPDNDPIETGHDCVDEQINDSGSLDIIRSSIPSLYPVYQMSEYDPGYVLSKPELIFDRLPGPESDPVIIRDPMAISEYMSTRSVLSTRSIQSLSDKWTNHQPNLDLMNESAPPSLLSSLPSSDVLSDSDDDEGDKANPPLKREYPVLADAVNLFGGISSPGAGEKGPTQYELALQSTADDLDGIRAKNMASGELRMNERMSQQRLSHQLRIRLLTGSRT